MTLGFVPRARSSYTVVIDVVIGLEVECGDIEMMRADRKAQKASKNTFGEDKTTENLFSLLAAAATTTEKHRKTKKRVGRARPSETCDN